MISGIHHVNILVPDGTLDQATEFYSDTLGLESAPVPELQKGTILWCVPISQHLKIPQSICLLEKV